MPKKRNQESEEVQSARFAKSVSEMITAGELNPTEADSAMERLMAGEREKLDRKGK